MRPPLLLGIALVLAVAADASAGSSGDPEGAVREALDDLGVSLPQLDLDPSAPGHGGPAPAPQTGSGGTAAVGSVVLDPLGAVGQGLVALGLSILFGFFTGVAEGARTVQVAAVTTAEAPLQSLAIGSAAVAIVGLLGLLAAALQRYGSLGAIPLFSRIAKDALLDHKVRADIMALVQANPGANVSEISRRLDIAWGTATHHLQKLRAERLVHVRMVGHQKCYFPNGGAFTPREIDVMSATKHPTARRIAAYLVAAGPSPHCQVAEALGLSPALVSFHTRKLESAGVLARERRGRNTIFVPLEAELNPSPRPSIHSI